MAECPNCGTSVGDAVVMCTQCGTNVKTGERFATKVKKGGKGKQKKGDSKAPNAGIFVAIVVLLAGLFAYNYQEQKRIQKINIARIAIEGPIKEARKFLDDGDGDKALDKVEMARRELDGQKNAHEKDEKFLAALGVEDLEKRIRDIQEASKELINERRRKEQLAAEARKVRQSMIAQGRELWEGEWLRPAQIRQRGFRKVDGNWVSTKELLRCGWALIDGDYRPPEDIYRRGYRFFEGQWRKMDDVRQAAGDVPTKDGRWISQAEALKNCLKRVTRKGDAEGEIARVERDGKGGIKVYPAAGGYRGYNKDMVRVLKIEVHDLDEVYRAQLARMQTEKNPAKLMAMASEWLADPALKWWPNAKWQAQRCRELAELRRKRLPVGTQAQAAAALKARPPISPKPRPAAQTAKPPAKSPAELVKANAATLAIATKKLTKSTKRPPEGTLMVPKSGVAMYGFDKNMKLYAYKYKPQRGDVMPFVTEAKRKDLYFVAFVVKGKGYTGYLKRSDVKVLESKPAAKPRKPAVKPAKPATKPPKSAWVTVVSPTAKVQTKKGGKWVAVATLKKGDKARVIQPGKRSFWVEVTVGGKKVRGWLLKKDAK